MGFVKSASEIKIIRAEIRAYRQLQSAVITWGYAKMSKTDGSAPLAISDICAATYPSPPSPRT